jgi:hypothetical protein
MLVTDATTTVRRLGGAGMGVTDGGGGGGLSGGGGGTKVEAADILVTGATGKSEVAFGAGCRVPSGQGVVVWMQHIAVGSAHIHTQ